MASLISTLSNLRLRKDSLPTFAPRRFYYLILIWLLLATLLILGHNYLFTDGTSLTPAGWKFPFATPPPDDDTTVPAAAGRRPTPEELRKQAEAGKTQLRVAILEAAGVHDEVVSALIHAFGGQKHVSLRMYQTKSRYEMRKIVDEFELPSPILEHAYSSDLTEVIRHNPPHVVVSTTCELDTKMRPSIFQELLKTNAFLFCLAHHAEQWTEGTNVNVARKFAAKNRLDMIALSNHTGEFLIEHGLSQWGEDARNVRVRVLPPVFPVHALGPADGEINLALQGDFSSARRDYDAIFKDLNKVIDKAQAAKLEGNVTLHLIGHGTHPAVPDDIADHVTFDESLSYPQFYSILSSAFAVLPAFASDEYFDRKASSTVPASLIAGAPLIASEQLLEAYNYLPREAAWVVKKGESELDTVRRAIGDKDAFEKKRWMVTDVRERLLRENVENAHQWIVEGLRRLPSSQS